VETLPSMFSEYVYYFDILLADVFFYIKLICKELILIISWLDIVLGNQTEFSFVRFSMCQGKVSLANILQ